MKSAMSLLIIAGVLVWMWAFAAVQVTQPAAARFVSQLTPGMYAPIQAGMGVDDVIAAIGHPPTDRLAQANFLMLVWEDANKSAIRVRFKSGRVHQAESTADISDRVVDGNRSVPQ